jgi:hypothetical protein
MAKHLNQKLCEVNPSWRYSANLANKHPWITRNPNDEIPLTFNEILNRTNCKKNGSYLLMICVFLNYYKKKEIKKKIKEQEKDNDYYMDNFIKKRKNKLYHITKKYINKCNVISQKQKEKYLKQKERYLDVISTDEEDSIEKKQSINNNISKTSRPPIKKGVRFSVDLANKKKPLNNEKNNIYNFYILSVPNKNNNNRYKNVDGTKINNKNDKVKNTIDIKNINNDLVKMRSKSIAKFKLKTPREISFGKDKVAGIKSTKEIPRLPNVFRSAIKNNNINTTNKKNDNYFNIKKCNIVPIVLPFIKEK